jgi:hypothetical protein
MITKKKIIRRKKIDQALQNELLCSIKRCGKYDSPVIEPYEIQVPNSLKLFSTTIKNNYKDEVCAHFYTYDYLFMRVLDNPAKYVDYLLNYNCVIAPDFSQYLNFPIWRRLSNSCNNKLIAAYWQKMRVNVVVNVTWSDPNSYDYCFDGIPTNCTIAINSMGIKQYDMSKYFWQKGYDEALKRLNPTAIIRYGDKMPNENESISYYFPNEHINRMRYGR